MRMNTVTRLILSMSTTQVQPARVAASSCCRNGRSGRARDRHFQFLNEWRNHQNDTCQVSQRVTGKKCLTNQVLPVAISFPHLSLGNLDLWPAYGSGTRPAGAP